MKLSKKKISKLLKQNHQSRKQIYMKKYKPNKQRNKSFRKRKTFNLRNKTLKKKKLFGGQVEANGGDVNSPVLTDLSAPSGDLTEGSDDASAPRGDITEILNDPSLQDGPKIDELGNATIVTEQVPEDAVTDTALLAELDEEAGRAPDAVASEADADSALLAELDEESGRATDAVAAEADADSALLAELDEEAARATEAEPVETVSSEAELNAEDTLQSPSAEDAQLQPDASKQTTESKSETEPNPENDAETSSPVTTNSGPTDIKTIMSTTEDINDKIFTITIRVPKSSYVQYTGDGNSAEQLLTRLTQTAGKRLKKKLTRKHK